MKIYQVVRRGQLWHAVMPDASPGTPPARDRASIVAWICEIAKQNHGAVKVRDIGGQVEMLYTYEDGVEHHHDGAQASHVAAKLGKL